MGAPFIVDPRSVIAVICIFVHGCRCWDYMAWFSWFCFLPSWWVPLLHSTVDAELLWGHFELGAWEKSWGKLRIAKFGHRMVFSEFQSCKLLVLEFVARCQRLVDRISDFSVTSEYNCFFRAPPHALGQRYLYWCSGWSHDLVFFVSARYSLSFVENHSSKGSAQMKRNVLGRQTWNMPAFLIVLFMPEQLRLIQEENKGVRTAISRLILYFPRR